MSRHRLLVAVLLLGALNRLRPVRHCARPTRCRAEAAARRPAIYSAHTRGPSDGGGVHEDGCGSKEPSPSLAHFRSGNPTMPHSRPVDNREHSSPSYPDVSRSRIRIEWSYPSEASLEVTLKPTPGSIDTPQVFYLGLTKRGTDARSRWVVDSWTAAAPVSPPPGPC